MKRSPTLAHGFLRILAALVPADRRREWREEWEAELEALVEVRSSGRAEAHPGIVSFVVGALPHALWIRTEGWTMESVVQDLRYAARGLWRAPGFTLVAALTLALGIGANAAMFSLVNGLLLRPPAGIVEPERLVQIARSYDQAPRWDNWSWPNAELIRSEGEDVFSGVAGFSTGSFVMGRGDDAEAVLGQYVSGRYFSVLGVLPFLGRPIDPSDELAPGGHAVVVLGHGLWTRRFGADPGVIGRTVSIGSVPYEIVGVAPADFVGIDATGSTPQLFVPAYQRGNAQLFEAWGSSWYYLFGRLADGVSFGTAAAAMDPVTMQVRAAHENNEGVRVLLAPGVGLTPEERAEAGRITLLLSAIAALVLLLTCANVGNLFLARATARAGDVGVRQALGASRGRLVRQLVTESLVLAVVATAFAVPVLGGASRLLPLLVPSPVNASLAPDTTVYLFLGGIGLLAGLLFGALPSWSVTRHDVARTLREGGTTGGRRRTRLRDALVVGQLALSLGLMSGAALLGRSILNARVVEPGFDPDGMVVAFTNLRSTGRHDDAAAVIGFQERVVEELSRTPGVASAAIAGQAPVVGGHSRSTVVPADRANDPEAGFEAEYTVVTPGYFETLDIRVLKGRTFREPALEPEPVVVINEALAELFWPAEDAVGKELAERKGNVRVIGVVEDVQMRSLRARANPGAYYPFHQEVEPYSVIHVRARGSTSTVIPELRGAVGAVDPEVPVTGITDLRDGLSRSLSETRTFVLVVSTFAGLALVLSLIGLYGLITHGVSQRSREMGIRLALGADRSEVARLVLSKAMILAALGVGAGTGVALLLGRALQGVLFGVSPFHPGALAGAAAILAATSLVAAWIPARRAGRVDPMISLRD